MTSAVGYVWTWLPGATSPVVCGRVDVVGSELHFTHAASYLARSDAIPLQPEGLRLARGPQRPAPPLAHGVLLDAAPDAWGQRVIERRLAAHGRPSPDLLGLLLEGGSDRIGALDVTDSPEVHASRSSSATLDELAEAAEHVVSGAAFAPDLELALLHGTSVGGARPKALLDSDGDPTIAKFSVSTDAFPWIRAEAVGMELAHRCGVSTAEVTTTTTEGRDVVLVRRFDRGPNGTRRHVLSALTLLGLPEHASRHATYVDLVDLVRTSFTAPSDTLRELFRRIVVNVLVGNTDDHPRNHAAFWDGHVLELTPAYDICPQPRTGDETAQAMAYGRDGQRAARLEDVIATAEVYGLSPAEATAVVDECTTVVMEQFDDVVDLVGASDATRNLLWRRAVANPSVFHRRP